MIVKNEEKLLARCLDSVAGLMDEIIIVDTGSSDKTKEIAARYTDKIYDFEWIDDFSAARNFAFSKAKKPTAAVKSAASKSIGNIGNIFQSACRSGFTRPHSPPPTGGPHGRWYRSRQAGSRSPGRSRTLRR